MTFTIPINLNKFNFKWKPMLNKCLKTMKDRKHIRFGNKWIISYMFGMRINKYNKVTEAIKWKHKGINSNITKY
jgi:hypothetical protein